MTRGATPGRVQCRSRRVTGEDWEQSFPALRREIDGQVISYLDNAATTLKPRSVIRAVTEYYETNGANIHRGKHRLSEEASDMYEAARVAIARYIGAAANEVVLLRNTSEALNLITGVLPGRAAPSRPRQGNAPGNAAPLWTKKSPRPGPR